jgi:hypothetical protein
MSVRRSSVRYAGKGAEQDCKNQTNADHAASFSRLRRAGCTMNDTPMLRM